MPTLLSAAPAIPTPTALEKARELHAQGHLLPAAVAYREALESRPNDTLALLGLSLIARQTRQLEPALNMARAALAAAPLASLAASVACSHIGHCHFELGQYTEAELAFQQALVPCCPPVPIANIATENSAKAEALVGLGQLYAATRRPTLAAGRFQQALELQPTLSAAHFGLGNAHALQDQFPAALACFECAAQLAPNTPETHFAVAFAQSKLGRHTQAIHGYRRALALAPDFASAWLNLGVELIADGRDDLAEPCYRQAFSALPESNPTRASTQISALLNHGHLHRSRRHFADARQLYQQALDLALANPSQPHPRLAEILVAFTFLHLEQQQFPQAWQSIQAAEVALHDPAQPPPNPEVPNARGILLLAQHAALAAPEPYAALLDQAIQAFEQAEALGHKTAASNRGNALLRLGRCTEALAAHQAALELDPTHPGVRYNLALTQLRLGDFTNGLPNYEIRWLFRELHPHPRRFHQPRWQGEPLPAGSKLLIYSEQGLGDTLQHFRYLAHVTQILSPCPNPAPNPTCHIILEVQPALTRLLTLSLANLQSTHPHLTAEILAHGDPIPAFTHHVPLLSLPALFQTTPETIPTQIPYLHTDPDLAPHANPRQTPAASHPAIGINWAGNPRYRADLERSTRLETFLPLLKIPNLRWISLQNGDPASQIAQLPPNLRPQDACSADRDLADTAAILSRLDLVITTDTAIAHLAGALGKPLWLLLPWQSDWRWMQDSPTTPWYPSARLFRQSSPNNWPELIRRVARELHSYFE